VRGSRLTGSTALL